MSADKWIQEEISFQDELNNLKIRYYPCTTITVKVLRGSDISVGYIHDFLDTPDPQVYLHCQDARGRKNFKTKVARDSIAPVWNESFTFILPEGKENATIQVDVYEEDRLKPDPHLGSGSFGTENLVFDKPREVTLEMGKHGKIYLELLKRWRTRPDCRMSLGLCEQERKFRIDRKPKTMKAMQKLLGKEKGPKSLSETPTVALAITGGGYRALASSCGAMEALEENDIVATLMYIAGLSGSSWYISTSYQKESLQHLDKLIEHHDWIRSRSARSLYSFVWDTGFLMRFKEYRRFKSENEQRTTLVDMFGLGLGETFLDETSPRSTLSSLKSYVETADTPFPLLSCAHVHENLPMSVFWDEVELSPFEISFPSYGINIPSEKFNSKWGNGILQQELPEPPLHFMMGTSGSAFAILWNKISDRTEARTDVKAYVDEIFQEHQVEDDEEDDDEEDVVDGSVSSKRRGTNFESDHDWLEQLEDNKQTDEVDGIAESQQHTLGRNFLIERTAKVNNCATSFVKLQKFLFNTNTVDPENAKGRTRHTVSTKNNTMALCDPGIGCNLPAIHVMRPQRTVDVLIVVDCAPYAREDFLDMGSFATVHSQLYLHGIKFPRMSIDKIAQDPFREVYLFEDTDDDDCPVVIWFTLANGHFRKLENPPRRSGYPKPDAVDEGKVKFNDFSITPDSAEYSTTQLHSEPLSFDRLRELMKFNISTNIQLVKDKIASKVETLRKRK